MTRTISPDSPVAGGSKAFSSSMEEQWIQKNPPSITNILDTVDFMEVLVISKNNKMNPQSEASQVMS
jgi:hypothetical protein